MAKKILLADDSLTIQKVVELTLSDSDYDLVCVSNGQRALEKVREDRPDLILADVVMPEKNGYEVCEVIKGNPATARIPVILLSGTFEPFDRERAERIGADAIISKPFDSQQLLAQVETLLDRAGSAVGPEAEAMPIAPPPSSAEAPEVRSEEKDPFDTGFSAEDFTAGIRLPPMREGMDPFEEEYGRTDVDSAIAAFERSRPEFAAPVEETSAAREVTESASDREEGSVREPLSPWLREEPEKGAAVEEAAPAPQLPDAGSLWGRAESERTDRIRLDSPTVAAALGPPAADQVPTLEIPQQTVSLEKPVGPAPDERATWDTSAPPPPQAPLPQEPEPVAAPQAPEGPGAAPVPHEIEVLAQTSSIPELTQMLSSVAKTEGELTEDQIERLATRVVQKLSDRIVREIAWEVIPDMAEIVIKQRIKELESGIE